MSARDDGGQAFPITGELIAVGERALQRASLPGMTLRDFFAAQFMARAQSLSTDRDGSWNYETASQCAYEMADAMIEARK